MQHLRLQPAHHDRFQAPVEFVRVRRALHVESEPRPVRVAIPPRVFAVAHAAVAEHRPPGVQSVELRPQFDGPVERRRAAQQDESPRLLEEGEGQLTPLRGNLLQVVRFVRYDALEVAIPERARYLVPGLQQRIRDDDNLDGAIMLRIFVRIIEVRRSLRCGMLSILPPFAYLRGEVDVVAPPHAMDGLARDERAELLYLGRPRVTETGGAQN